ncbi:MAG: aldo/keto reductase [Bacteroidia bacterium]|nr:aldo/keto reductase [Bacteroidia bacterium]
MDTPFSLPSHPNVRRIGLGLAALGRPGYINLGHAEDLQNNYDQAFMEHHAHEVLDLAWKEGIRHFDTARSYGLGELFLGNWLKNKGLPKDQVLISSKWGYTYTADWQIQAEHHEVKEHSLGVLDRQWKESQEILGEYLDLYQIHSATLESGVLENTEVLNRLAELKAQGTSIGLSTSGANQSEVLRKAMEIEVDGKPLFDSFQSTFNLLERSAGPLLQEASEAGKAIIIKEALANGRLTARNQQPEFKEKFQLLAKISQNINTSIDALSLAFILKHSWVDQVLSGAANTEHLLSNMEAAKLELSEEILNELEGLKEDPQKYWAKRKSLAWN